MKPILKHELKNGVIVAIILSIINIFIWISQLNSLIDINGNSYIYGNDDDLMSFISIIDPTIILVGIIAMSILVTMQFKSDKESGTRDFLAVLPYTNKQRFCNKVLVGAMTICITFIISVISIYVLQGQYKYYQDIIYTTSSYEEELRQITSFCSLSLILLYIYIQIFIYYLFLTVLQYMIKGSKAPIVIGNLVFVSIPYIFFSILYYLRDMFNITSFSNENLIIFGSVILDVNTSISRRYLMINDSTRVYVGDGISENYISKIIMLVLVGTIIFVLGKICSEKYGLIERKSFFVNRCIELIFKIGVTVCSGLLPFSIGFMLQRLTRNYFWNPEQYSVLITICMIVAGCIGFFISNKIAKGGRS